MPVKNISRPSPAPAPRGSWIGVLLAGCTGLMLAVGLMLLTMGWIGPVLVLAALIFGFAALNYFVWGRWLARVTNDEQDDDDAGQPFWTVKRGD